MTEDRPAAPVQSADFWQHPELRVAVRDRHFGRLLRVYRTVQSPPILQTQLAAWLGITQGQLSRIERSSESVRELDKIIKWSDALHLPLELRWFDSTAATVQEPWPSAVDDHPGTVVSPASQLGRRDVLKAAGAVTASGLMANAPWQKLMESVDDDRPVDAATIQLMSGRTADFYDTERTAPARRMIDSLIRHRATLVALVKNARDGFIRNQIATLIGETEALLGWLQFDLKRTADAGATWRRALKIAKETGDGPLAACVLGYWSYLASSQNDVLPAVNLLKQAEDYVPGSSAPATRAWITARQAEELGRLGDETGALRALERSFTAFDFAQPRTERLWTSFFTANRLGGMTIATYVGLHHPDATAVGESVLTALAPTDYKSRGLILADLARLAIRNGELDHAGNLVKGAIETTERNESGIAQQRLLVLVSEMNQLGAAREAAELRERVLARRRF